MIWRHILSTPNVRNHLSAVHLPTVEKILSLGPLARRITKALGSTPTHEEVLNVYSRLCDCLAQRKIFEA
jgi:hypothetical protein